MNFEEIRVKGKTLVTEESLYKNTNPMLKKLSCANCGDKGGLYLGVMYISCRSCLNLCLDEQEFLELYSEQINKYKKGDTHE
jgi:hypothetical protein